MTTTTEIPKPADRAEWLAARRPYFNASAAAVLFDRHPYLSPGAYTRTKLTGEEQGESDAMVRGRMLEDALAQWWAHRHGDVAVWEPDQLYISGRVMATVDRFASKGDIVPDLYEPIEIKTTNRYTGETPETHWLDQCQAIMLCTGAESIWLVWMDASLRLYEHLVDADPAWQEAIAVMAETFMAWIDLGMVPEGVTLSYDDAGAIYPVGEVAKVDLDIDAKAALDHYRAARRNRLEWEKTEDRAKGVVATALGSAELGMWNGAPVVEWKSIKPRRQLDMGQLRARFGDELDEFYIEVPQRRLRALGKDEEEVEG